MNSYLAVCALVVAIASGQTTRGTHEELQCDSRRPVGCTPDRPADCADENVQLWLPQANNELFGICGRCYYCKTTPTFEEKEACPRELCPVISPLCNQVKPLIVVQGDRRCRGCSECVSYNSCPPLSCPRRIRRCEAYRANYRYINGQLCPACRVCSRYKGNTSRPDATPLPCPLFNITACPLVDKCLRYVDRFVNLGEGRQCQVCPDCLEWEDPNVRISAANTTPANLQLPVPACSESTCPTLPDCPVEHVYRNINGSRCRECDRCVGASTSPSRQSTDGGSDAMVTPQPNRCPDLSRCPSRDGCDDEIVNRTIRIWTNDVCPWCQSCGRSQPSECPIRRCPSSWCNNTAVFTRLINGTLCEVCVCTDDNQDCSSPSLTCPTTDCMETEPGLVTIDDHMCTCPVCKTTSRSGPDGGADVAQPDVRNGGQARRSTLPRIVTTTRATTTASQADTLPNCVDIVLGMTCPQTTCALVVTDVQIVNGVECYGCMRCLSDVGSASRCPTFNCPQTQHCGDNEDIAQGRRYREIQSYTIDSETCTGCEVCLNCSIPKCPRLDPRCERYMRRTDRRGCPLCPFCEVWQGSTSPPVIGKSGFVQSVSTAHCLTAYGNFSNELPGLVTSACSLDTSEQVWTFSTDQLMQDVTSHLCASYFSAGRPIVMRVCTAENPNMIWTLERNNRLPQFFRIKHERMGQCLDTTGTSLSDGSIPLGLSACEDLVSDGHVISHQWWKFEQV